MEIAELGGIERSALATSSYLTRLNAIRRAHPALGDLQNLTLHGSTDNATVVYSKHKTLPDGTKDTLIIVVNVDPQGIRESTVTLDLAALELDPADLTHNGRFMVDDLLTGESWEWGEYNYVRLDAHVEPAHILSIRRHHQ